MLREILWFPIKNTINNILVLPVKKGQSLTHLSPKYCFNCKPFPNSGDNENVSKCCRSVNTCILLNVWLRLHLGLCHYMFICFNLQYCKPTGLKIKWKWQYQEGRAYAICCSCTSISSKTLMYFCLFSQNYQRKCLFLNNWLWLVRTVLGHFSEILFVDIMNYVQVGQQSFVCFPWTLTHLKQLTFL